MPHSALSVNSDSVDGGVRVSLGGELDIATAPRAEEEIRRAEESGAGTLVIDLAGLSFMDSTGLRLIVSAAERSREAERRLVIVRGPDPVQRVLELTGMDHRLELVESPDQI